MAATIKSDYGTGNNKVIKKKKDIISCQRILCYYLRRSKQQRLWSTKFKSLRNHLKLISCTLLQYCGTNKVWCMKSVSTIKVQHRTALIQFQHKNVSAFSFSIHQKAQDSERDKERDGKWTSVSAAAVNPPRRCNTVQSFHFSMRILDAVGNLTLCVWRRVHMTEKIPISLI